MSQSNKRRPTKSGPARPTGSTQRPISARTSRPGVVKQPVGGRSSQSSFRATIDRVLPPFSAQRYVAIWLPITALLLIIILVLARGNSASSGTASQCTASSLGPGKFMVIETDKGCIISKLHTEPEAKVTNTIANFEQKANTGYFNGKIFHRVENWVIQGGDPLGNGTGGGEMPSEYNQLPFKAGALGVARRNDPAKNNDSQFFIVKTDAENLNGQYTNFGQVVEGMDVVQKIAIGDKMTKVTVEDRK